MPYTTNANLPDNVRLHLPPPAQDIFRETFNSAFKTNADNPRCEEIAHRVAWGGG